MLRSDIRSSNQRRVVEHHLVTGRHEMLRTLCPLSSAKVSPSLTAFEALPYLPDQETLNLSIEDCFLDEEQFIAISQDSITTFEFLMRRARLRRLVNSFREWLLSPTYLWISNTPTAFDGLQHLPDRERCPTDLWISNTSAAFNTSLYLPDREVRSEMMFGSPELWDDTQLQFLGNAIVSREPMDTAAQSLRTATGHCCEEALYCSV
jgi:hypothetical protein